MAELEVSPRGAMAFDVMRSKMKPTSAEALPEPQYIFPPTRDGSAIFVNKGEVLRAMADRENRENAARAEPVPRPIGDTENNLPYVTRPNYCPGDVDGGFKVHHWDSYGDSWCCGRCPAMFTDRSESET